MAPATELPAKPVPASAVKVVVAGEFWLNTATLIPVAVRA